MAITIDGTTGITTPGLTNTGTETIVNLTTTGNTILGDASTDTLNVGNGGIVKDASGNVGIGTASPTQKLDVTGNINTSGSLNSINTFGFKNRIINGNFIVAQRGASIVIPTGYTINYYAMDRWIVNTNSLAVTCMQPTYGSMKITSAAGANTAIFCSQRIEDINSYSLAGNTVTLSGLFATSEAVNVTWTAYYANTVNTFGTTGAPTKTQIATGTFTTSSGGLSGTASFAVPLGATTGIEIVFSVTISGNNWVILRNIQLEKGSTATSFDERAYGTELSLCQRYYEIGNIGFAGQISTASGNLRASISFMSVKRTMPTMVFTGAGTNFTNGVVNSDGSTIYQARAYADATSTSASGYWIANYTASAEL